MIQTRRLHAISLLLAASAQVSAAPEHLATPSIYDNVAIQIPWGQSFVAEEKSFLSISWYIGDPGRVGDSSVNGITGTAELVIYALSPGELPHELGRNLVNSPGQEKIGLVSFSLANAVPTTVGQKYFAALLSDDPFGIGLRSTSSTYSNGSEAYILATGYEEIGGRDTAFAVSGVPEPSQAAFLVFGGLSLAGLVLGRRAKA